MIEYGAAIAYQKGRDSRRIVYEKRNRRGAWACYDGDADGRSSFDGDRVRGLEAGCGTRCLQLGAPRGEHNIHVVLARLLMAGACRDDRWRTVVGRVAADLRKVILHDNYRDCEIAR